MGGIIPVRNRRGVAATIARRGGLSAARPTTRCKLNLPGATAAPSEGGICASIGGCTQATEQYASLGGCCGAGESALLAGFSEVEPGAGPLSSWTAECPVSPRGAPSGDT